MVAHLAMVHASDSLNSVGSSARPRLGSPKSRSSLYISDKALYDPQLSYNDRLVLLARIARRRRGTRGSVLSCRTLAADLPMSPATAARCDAKLLARGYLVRRGTVRGRPILAVVVEKGARRVPFAAMLLGEMVEQVRQGVPKAEQLTGFDVWLGIFLTDRRGEVGHRAACGFTRKEIRARIAERDLVPPDEHTITASVARLSAAGLVRRECKPGLPWILTPMFAPPKRRCPEAVSTAMTRARARARIPRRIPPGLAAVSPGGAPVETPAAVGGEPFETVGGAPFETAGLPAGDDFRQVSAARREDSGSVRSRTNTDEAFSLLAGAPASGTVAAGRRDPVLPPGGHPGVAARFREDSEVLLDSLARLAARGKNRLLAERIARKAGVSDFALLAM